MTTTPYLELDDQATGANNNTWGDVADANFAILEQAIARYLGISTTGGTTTLTTSQNRYPILRITGVLVSNATIVVRTAEKNWNIINATTGNFTVTVKTLAGTGKTIPRGRAVMVYCDGTNVELVRPLGTMAAQAGGTVNAITATFEPALVSAELQDGMLFLVEAAGANTTTTPTFNPDGLGALTITKNGGQALVAGDIRAAGHKMLLCYDASSTRYELLNPSLSDASGNTTISGTLVMGSSFLRNRIINGDMRIDQRNNGASVTLGVSSIYGTDRWQSNEDTDGGMTVQQSTTTPPTGFTHSMLFTTTVADATLAAGQYATTQQKIEGFNVSDLGWGAAGALPVTVSFWVRSSLTGSHSGAVQNDGQTRSYPFSYTISAANTWEYKTITIPGDTTGTWLTTTGVGIRLLFDLGSGSSLRGTAGAWAASGVLGVTGAVSVIGTLSATWQITGVQLEAGSVATPFERRQYGQELALCQRYYETVGITAVGAAATGMATTVRYAVVKRTAPSVTRTGNWLTANEAGTSVSIGEAAQMALSNSTAGATAVGGTFTVSAEP